MQLEGYANHFAFQWTEDSIHNIYFNRIHVSVFFNVYNFSTHKVIISTLLLGEIRYSDLYKDAWEILMQRIESRYSDLDHFAWGPQKKLKEGLYYFCLLCVHPCELTVLLQLLQSLYVFQRWGFHLRIILFLKKMYSTRQLGFPFFPQLPVQFKFLFKKLYIWSFFILCLPEQFNWDDYLKETESVAAPLHCFRQV